MTCLNQTGTIPRFEFGLRFCGRIMAFEPMADQTRRPTALARPRKLGGWRVCQRGGSRRDAGSLGDGNKRSPRRFLYMGHVEHTHVCWMCLRGMCLRRAAGNCSFISRRFHQQIFATYNFGMAPTLLGPPLLLIWRPCRRRREDAGNSHATGSRNQIQT